MLHIDRTTINNEASNCEDELADMFITIGDKGETVNMLKDRKIFAGEQNISMNENYYDKTLQQIVHEVTIIDGNSAPWSTLSAIEEHLGEFATAPHEHFTVRLRSKSALEPTQRIKYETFKNSMKDTYPTINIEIL